jgi:hypothetical protein
MKRHRFTLGVLIGAAATLGSVLTVLPQTGEPTLKEVYKDHFIIGAAINRTIALSAAPPGYCLLLKRDYRAPWKHPFAG